MQLIKVDVAIIGAGSAGLSAYRAARTHGKTALLIEGGHYGTTCARVGCMPSKLLIAAADAAHMANISPVFGVFPENVRVDGRLVMERVRKERDRFVGFVLDSVERISERDRSIGHARFLSPETLVIDDHTRVEAGAIVIATGASAEKPQPLKAAGRRLVTSDDVFDWQDLPESIAVVGTGIVGLELGQALHRLGVRVAFFGRNDRVGPFKDKAVQDCARKVLGDELDLRLDTEIVGVETMGESVRLRSRGKDGKDITENYEWVLAATGRAPNVDKLDLEKSGLKCDEDGVPLFDRHTMQCGQSAIFIAGDAADDRPLLHEAVDSGRIAGENAAQYPAVKPGLRRTALSIAFTEPQMAVVGTIPNGDVVGDFVIGQASFDDQGRSRVMLQNHGLLRVHAQAGDGRFLGAEMFGPQAEHIGHLMAWACQSGMTLADMLAMPFYHPVVEEGLRSALRDALEKLPYGRVEISHSADATPGM
jgi:dihydrolipoamide dehydrogenase